jgi:hypothetical protein
MMTLRVRYARADELQKDLDRQLAHGGILLRVADTGGLELHQRVALQLVAPDGRAVSGEGEILHVQAGHGVAVSFPAAEVLALREIAAGLPADAAGSSGAARHERVDDAGSDAGNQAESAAADGAGPQDTGDDHDDGENDDGAGPHGGEARKSEAANKADKIQLALHGTKDERTAILRDRNKMLHAYVLRNPQITADEVLAVAKNPLSSPELLGQVADRKEWYQKSTIAVALARNPKTPQGAGLRALEFVAQADLRQIAKGTSAPPHIVAAARKKILR